MLPGQKEVYDVLFLMFSIVVVTHITVNKLNNFDTIIIVFALVIMLMYYLSNRNNVDKKESFVESTAPPETPTMLQDTIDDLGNSLSSKTVIYTSAFNTNSYNGSGKLWKNISKLPSNNQCPDTSSSPGNLVFDVDPVFNKATGFSLKSTSIKGPLSCSLGINMNGTFSICIAFKNNDLTGIDGEIEIVKLYGNSDKNKGISLTIPAGTIKTLTDGIYTCRFVLNFGNSSFYCDVKANRDIVMEANLMTFFFITKAVDNINVYMLTEKHGRNPSPVQILSRPFPAVDGNFSNKELNINTNKNWNVGIFNFGIFNITLDTTLISSLYLNFMNYYNRNIDESFRNLLIQNKTYVDSLTEAKSCNFDEDTCNKCTNIKWTNPLDLISLGSADCKKAVNDFCSRFPNDPKCTTCWSSSSSQYNSDSCIALRGIFTNQSRTDMNEQDLESIKTKYNLIKKDQCPSTPAPDNTANTTNTASKRVIDTGIKNFYPGGDAKTQGQTIEIESDGPLNIDIRKESGKSIWETVKSLFM